MAAQPLEHPMESQSPVVERPRNTFLRQRGKGREVMAYLPYLRAWRLAVGLTQERLAVMSNVTISTISRIERAPLAHPCHLNLVHRLGKALGISNHALIFDKPPEQLPDNHALGRVVRISEEDGELRFHLPYLRLYLNDHPEPGDIYHFVPQVPLAELSKRTGIPARELEELCQCRMGATIAQLQRIAAALGQSLLRLLD